MASSAAPVSLGWGNQPRVILHAQGSFLAPEVPVPLELSAPEALSAQGDGLYRMAAIVDDQAGNPFVEAKLTRPRLEAAFERLVSLYALCQASGPLPPGLNLQQCQQLRASAAVVALSLAESQKGKKAESNKALVKRIMEVYFAWIPAEPAGMLRERLVLNLDWVAPALPKELGARARKVMAAELPLSPPYEAWFAQENTLRVVWKCGMEFLEGWRKRLQRDGFALKVDGGSYGVSQLSRAFVADNRRMGVVIELGPEQGNVFAAMSDPAVHIVGYDGHSDWGRRIPRALERAPEQVGPKAIFYLLCCGKQILQKVRDRYPLAQVVTTFNSARFTADFSYSEDYTAFLHLVEGMARRETWEQLAARVNKDWYNNPNQNYLFPSDALAMARSLDRDHDGQADMFDKLVDFNTFAVAEGTAGELAPRVPETPAARFVGTRLHFAVQVFHTLCHFNEQLEAFTHDLRVFADGWYDPTQPAEVGSLERGPVRVSAVNDSGVVRYFLKGSSHFAHASEDAWRAMAAVVLGTAVLAREPAGRGLSGAQRVLVGLLLAAQSLEVDDAPGRDEAIWQAMLPVLGLPVMSLSQVQAAKRLSDHWYSGSRASVKALEGGLSAEVRAALEAWASLPASFGKGQGT